ncbi:hypothetical protein PS1_027565 [Malus domestica]
MCMDLGKFIQISNPKAELDWNCSHYSHSALVQFTMCDKFCPTDFENRQTELANDGLGPFLKEFGVMENEMIN